MPFFKFRRGDASPTSPAGSATQALSVEVLRKRARHRLMGASVLVLLGVIGFPLLFDTQPRPVAVNIPIEIPKKNGTKPLVAPAPAVTVAPALKNHTPAATPQTVPAASSLSAKEEIYPLKSKPLLADNTPSAIKKEANTGLKQETRPVLKPAPEPGDSARANALLKGTAASQGPKVAAVTKPAVAAGSKADAPESKSRMVVQVGAFADAAKAGEARRKLEKAGLVTYIQIADTKDGKRTRVRVGPFTNKAEVEKVVDKIRSLDLPAAVLSL